jgi:hypothetical protein
MTSLRENEFSESAETETSALPLSRSQFATAANDDHADSMGVPAIGGLIGDKPAQSPRTVIFREAKRTPSPAGTKAASDAKIRELYLCQAGSPDHWRDV